MTATRTRAGSMLGRTALVLVLVFATAAGAACPGGRCGPERAGCGGPGGCGQGMRGRGADGDHAVFHALLAARDRIRREVILLPDGVETLTESDDPEVAKLIGVHIHAMYARLKDGRPIHARDPLFAELFRHADAITMVVEPTAHGFRVRETSTDAWVAKLIQAHAEVVSGFLREGHAEMRRDHPVPPR